MPHRVLVSLLLAGVSAGALAAASDVRREFARPHQPADVGGRRRNLYCSGTGPVTVLDT